MSKKFNHSKKQGYQKSLIGLLLVIIPVLLLACLIIYPIISAIISTLINDQKNGLVLSLKAYRFFFTDEFSLNSLRFTLWTTLVSVLLLLIIGMPIAIYLRFSSGKMASYVQTLTVFPMFVPSIILSYALIRTIGPNGTLDIVLHHIGLPQIPSPYLTPWGPVIALVWDNLPITVLMLTAGLSAISNSAIEAARDVGANPWQVFWHIILPRMSNSLLVTSSFAVLAIFSAFTLPYLLGPTSPEMMGPLMQRTFGDLNDPLQAKTQAVISFGVCVFFDAFYVYSIAKNREG
ncbi:MAG: hypothetical protein CENE_01145 [Candidatus Celerinatantimonas neptuna]|nr:MAG: hypothetical protein CENE_01145 [Candidatus Celerinatantimonas neptuna]